jgi:1-acyl-sn-glycerol-3-phosphate acyltransferase
MIKKVRISIIYIVCFAVVFIGYRIFLKRIRVKGLKNYPRNRPVIIAANHTNAFLDAIIFHFVFFENIYSLARGDVFKSSINRFFLSKFNVLPIFRLQEGAEHLHKNEESFNKCIQVLEHNKPLLIFPEGNCVQEKRLRKLKKGIARIAFLAEEKNNFQSEICILPVGINYLNFTKFRGELFLNIGKPIDVKNYREAYLADKQKSYTSISNDVYSNLKELLVIVEEKENEILFEQINEILKHKYHSGDYRNISEKFNNWVKKINLPEVKEISSEYFSLLKKLKIKDWVVRKHHSNSMGYLLLNFILLSVSSPLFITGIVLNFIPYKVPFYITKKIVKISDFFLSVNLGIGVFFYIIYHQVFMIFISSYFDNYFWYFFIAIPVLGYFSLMYFEQFKKFLGVLRFFVLKRKNPTLYHNTIHLRNRLLKFWETGD